MSKLKQPLLQNGFTILELMIATAIVSVVLLLVTMVMMNIGNLYYKGVTQSRTQDDVRAIADDLTQILQTQAGNPNYNQEVLKGYTMEYFCINGDTRYTFIQGQQLGSGSPQLLHILWRDTLGAGRTCEAADLTAVNPSARNNDGLPGSGAELVAPSSRLTALCVGAYNASTGSCSPNFTSPYVLTVGVAYGDPALSPGVGTQAACTGATGDQFCATASLTATIVQRVQ